VKAKDKWELAMDVEIVSHEKPKHGIWLSCLKIEALHYKWVYQLKEENDGTKTYKTRLIVKR